MGSERRGRSIARQAIAGAAAGAAATWLMGRVTTWLYEREDPRALERENRARGGQTAYGIAAGKLANAVNVELSDDKRQQMGTAIHWALGSAAGAGYAVLRKQWPLAASLKGVPFGIAFFLGMDELANWALGFTPGPLEFPWQAHARGLAGHVAFGVANEMLLEGVDRVA
jgi:uncharacterized membrane protein YagU involved in acid resistance